MISIHVENGQQVEAGQQIATLQSDELALELAELESAFAHGELKQRSQRSKKQIVDLQVEQRRQESLAERIANCRRKMSELTLRAPIAGRVVARRLADLPGSYLAEGAEICSIVSDEHEFRILVGQKDLPAFASRLGSQLDVSFPGMRAPGILVSLEPEATSALRRIESRRERGRPARGGPRRPAIGPEWRACLDLEIERAAGGGPCQNRQRSIAFAGWPAWLRFVPRHGVFRWAADYQCRERLAAKADSPDAESNFLEMKQIPDLVRLILVFVGSKLAAISARPLFFS